MHEHCIASGMDSQHQHVESWSKYPTVLRSDPRPYLLRHWHAIVEENDVDEDAHEELPVVDVVQLTAILHETKEPSGVRGEVRRLRTDASVGKHREETDQGGRFALGHHVLGARQVDPRNDVHHEVPAVDRAWILPRNQKVHESAKWPADEPPDDEANELADAERGARRLDVVQDGAADQEDEDVEVRPNEVSPHELHRWVRVLDGVALVELAVEPVREDGADHAEGVAALDDALQLC
mmetsp:Transcript_26587/g.57755  ORF Transcript_26587/g.57755 Transcript_26587/m.57755 type:complete len:238 (-) Transcript_26587:3129-3842(-)